LVVAQKDDIDRVMAFMARRGITREELSEALPSRPTPESLRMILSKYRPPSDLLSHEFVDFFTRRGLKRLSARGLRYGVVYKRPPYRRSDAKDNAA
jgi:hypothetical protein